MTYQGDHTVTETIYEQLLSDGLDGLPEVITRLLNEAMKLERARYLQADPYERSSERVSHANGYKPKQLKTRHGLLDLQVPQTRDCLFYPDCLERGMRSERALKIAIAEMYFKGVSTRKVTKIMEEMCGFTITSNEASAAAKSLDEELSAWRGRPLGQYKYVYLDAVYEKMRHSGQVRDSAVLVATGIDHCGKREVIGISVELSEAEVHWRKFLLSLQSRGLSGVELFISDAHAGLNAARTTVFPSIPWQRCHFHLAQNAQSYAPKKSQREQVGEIIRNILTAPSLSEAQSRLLSAVKETEKTMPELSRWMEVNIPEGFAHFSFPQSHQRRIRTSNGLERLNREIRRRTKVVGIFPNAASCMRLITAILMEISDEWLAGKKYITI